MKLLMQPFSFIQCLVYLLLALCWSSSTPSAAAVDAASRRELQASTWATLTAPAPTWWARSAPTTTTNTTNTPPAPTTTAPPPTTTTAPPPPAPTAPAPPPAPTTSSLSALVDLGNGRRQFTTESLLDGMTAVLIVDNIAQRLEGTVTYEGNSYVAIAFSPKGIMEGSIGVIGTPSDGLVQKYDLFGRTTLRLFDNAQQTLENTSIVSDGVTTTLKFTKILKEANVVEIFGDNAAIDNIFLIAHGTDGQTDLHYHPQQSTFTVNFATGVSAASSPNENKTLWALHCICMALAWAFLIPISIACSLARAFIAKKGQWFEMHRIINSLGVVLTIIGFSIAVHLINKEPGKLAEHFSTLQHNKIALSVFIAAIPNAVWGIFRPHAQHAPDPAANKPSAIADHEDPRRETTIEAATTNDHHHDNNVPQKTPLHVAFEYGHRIIGVTAIVLGYKAKAA